MVRRLILFIVLLTSLLFAACAPIAPVPSEEPAGTASSASVESSESETHIVVDAQGREIQAPVAPQRVVVLSEQDLDGALAVGIKPVGATNGRGQQTLPLYLADQIEGIQSVGSFTEPSLETIAALNPDLILIGGIFPAIAALPDLLSEIAPTVVTYASEDDWKQGFLGTARALNREADAAAWLTDYDAQVQALRDVLGDKANAEISVVRWNPDGPVIMMPGSFSSLVSSDLGLQRAGAEELASWEGHQHTEPLSLEVLGRIDADWIFLGTLNADGVTSLASARENPLFRQLSAVQNDRVIEVDGLVWTSRGGPLAALTVLDDVRAALLE